MEEKCPRCKSSNIKKAWDKAIRKPRPFYKCLMCGTIYHYSGKGTIFVEN